MNRLGEALKLYMKIKDVGVRQIAKETGMSPATVSRFLNGKKIDSEHFMSMLNWLLEEKGTKKKTRWL